MATNNSLNILMTIFCFMIIKKSSAISYNQPKLCPLATWNPNAITFAEQDTVGKDPTGIFINTNNNVYVANRENGRILVWLNNSIKIIASNLSSPLSIFVRTNGDIYVGNGYANGRIDKFILNTNPNVLVMYTNSSCSGLFIDTNDTLYCSMYDHHQVIKRWLNSSASTSTTAAGTRIAGPDPNMLNSPYGIFVDIDFDLYVADCNNHRIQLFRSGQMNGTTVAGSGSRTTTITLKCPTGIVLDADKYLFIVEKDNHRIVGSGPNGFRCLVGCSSSSGPASNQLLYPRRLSFDSFGNMFVTDRGNNRIQKFLLSISSRNETMTSQTIHTSTKIYVPNSTTMTTLNIETNATTVSAERETTTAITTVKSTSAIDFNDSTSITSSLTTPTRTIPVETTVVTEMTKTRTTEAETISIETDLTTGTTSVATTGSYKPSSNNFMPPACDDPTRTGLFCNISNTVCDMIQPCQNNATCYNNDTDPHGYVCLCPLGFNGIQCQFDHRPCRPNTCWHDGICNETSNTTFICLCPSGWEGIHCERMVNYCQNITCLNKGVCRPLFLNYTCECLGESFSGRHCEITAAKIQIYRIVSKSFGYIAIIAMISVAMFIVIMDILKYCFGIDPVHEERDQIRRKKQAKKRKPIIQQFVYVNAPASSPPEQPISTIEETTV